MLTSIAYILLFGLFFGTVFKKMKLPSLLGMILTGILLGPHVLNWIDLSILNISADLRQIALVIILTRAGLTLDLEDLKKVGRPAFFMCFVPALLEITGAILLGTLLFHISVLDAALIGSVIAAVSPAVVVPRMINLIEKGYGKKHAIPQLILAGASVDDVIVIVIFSSLCTLSSAQSFSWISFIQIPVSIVLGLLTGVLCGCVLIQFFKKFHMRDSVKILILLSFSFLLIELENQLKGILPLSGLLGIMSLSLTIHQRYSILSQRLSVKYNKLWIGAEILLFVLVGCAVNIQYALSTGALGILFILGALVFRMIGVMISVTHTSLTFKERLFCMIAYTPKATVQAAIGSIPLTMGLPVGELCLTVAVLSILISAPLGAFGIDVSYAKLLTDDNETA